MATGNRSLALSGHTRAIARVSWSPDGKQLASASDDNTAKVWDPDKGAELLTLRGHSDRVTSVCWSPDGNRLATSSRDSTSKIWEIQTETYFSKASTTSPDRDKTKPLTSK